jgi:energy-converting hydrogenase B subunit D
VTVLQVVALLAVAATGTATVLQRNPLRQLITLGFLGLTLAALFLVFGAPDVALSQIVVGSVVVPAMVLLALARIQDDDHDERS